MTKIISFFMTIIMFLFPRLNIPEVEIEEESFNTQYTCVFVHGLSGWGDYDVVNTVAPYWGMLGGNLMTYLNARGFNCRAASVGGTESAWDRACELYAQLTGTRTDYGAEHSARCNHERYGTDYTGRALIDSFSAEAKINLFGHSFGGATILTFLELMANGSEKERNATAESELSDLFKGGKADWIYSVTTLAAPLNGTAAYYVQDDVLGDENATMMESIEVKMIGVASTVTDDRIEEDSANYDMHIDNAIKMVESFETLENVYYFSIPCSSCELDENGNYVNIPEITESLFQPCANRLAQVRTTTPDGHVIDESWAENDGLVNTISARAPFNAPQQDFDEDDIKPGIWNVLPTYRGDHMSLQGGMTVTNDVRELYVDFITMLNGL